MFEMTEKVLLGPIVNLFFFQDLFFSLFKFPSFFSLCVVTSVVSKSDL